VESGIGLFGKNVHRLFVTLNWLLIVTELASPIEIIDVIDSDLDHVSNDFSGVDIKHNNGSHTVSLKFIEVASDKFYHGIDLLN
jgi:hypothetical protein